MLPVTHRQPIQKLQQSTSRVSLPSQTHAHHSFKRQRKDPEDKFLTVSLTPEVVQLKHVLTRPPLQRSHNSCARNRISKLVSLDANPKYQELCRNRKIAQQSNQLDSFWSVSHSLQLVQQQMLRDTQHQSRSTMKSEVLRNKMKKALNEDADFISKTEVLNNLVESSWYFRKHKQALQP